LVRGERLRAAADGDSQAMADLVAKTLD